MDFSGMRIGLVGPLPPPAGGMANQTRQLAELLTRGGARVHIVQTNASYRPAAAARIPVLRAFVRLLPYFATLWRTAAQCDVFHVMANSGWSWHLFAAPAIWIARARGVPVVVNYRGGEAAEFLSKSAGVVRWSMQRAAKLAVPSAFLERVFARHGMVAEVVPNIVDLTRFHPRDGSIGRATHVIVARNLEPIYDNATALRAFAEIRRRFPQARLTLAGSGPEDARLRALAGDLGLAAEVEFTGKLDRDAMAQLYRRADVMLNASLVDNMPNALLEAMASGVPVVSTNVGGIPFMVRDGETALLVRPGDPAALAAAAVRVLDDRVLASRLARAGVAEVQRYTWLKVAPTLAAVYRSALA
ncbi:MAG: glycosyltransferase family 4 protein [Ramlibacter sp.]|nr:glycosyltransferase family 4 protein [Ramlibacter sp.]